MFRYISSINSSMNVSDKFLRCLWPVFSHTTSAYKEGWNCVRRRCLQTKAFTEPKDNIDPSKKVKEQHQPSRPSPYHYPHPSLPLPPLQQTLDKYFQSLKPFLSDGELNHTRKLLDEFGKPDGDGEKLQSLLEERARNHENWLEEWWLHKAYLESRSPLPVNVSPGIIFPCQHYSNIEGQLRTAAAFIKQILEFRELINTGLLEPDTVKGVPVCMSQYLKIFGSYRLPGGTHDEIIVGGENEEHPFIIAMHKNVLFQVPVQHDSGQPFTQHELFQQLLSVVSQASAHPTVPVGILTSQNRSSWSHAHKIMVKSKLNRHIFDLIQKSLFVLCLDSPVEEGDNHNGRKVSPLTMAGRQVMHGDGSKANSGNRWFDKTLQLIVGANGICGWNYEHTLIEGPPLFRMMEYLNKQTSSSLSGHSNHSGSSRIPKNATTIIAKPLCFELDAPMLALIDSAKDQMDTLVKDVELDVMDFHDYGKDYIKSRKFSPDSFFQMAIQLAFYRLYNQIPPTYESGSTRQFLRGRTETIRSASEESLKFVEAMVGGASSSTVLGLLTKAVNQHKNYGAEASKGQGIDRHLMGLKLTAVGNGMNVPAFLMDVGYTTSTHWKLSTSQGNSDVASFMCYGPAVADGYGCCYNPMKDRIIAGISSTHSYAATNSHRFAQTVADSLLDMKKIIA